MWGQAASNEKARGIQSIGSQQQAPVRTLCARINVCAFVGISHGASAPARRIAEANHRGFALCHSRAPVH